jgi:hypothetical protein
MNEQESLYPKSPFWKRKTLCKVVTAAWILNIATPDGRRYHFTDASSFQSKLRSMPTRITSTSPVYCFILLTWLKFDINILVRSGLDARQQVKTLSLSEPRINSTLQNTFWMGFPFDIWLMPPIRGGQWVQIRVVMGPDILAV